MRFGDRLRIARTKSNLTQGQLADMMGTKCNSVSNWEKGVSKPYADMLPPLCNILGIDANWLLGFNDSEETPALAPAALRVGKAYEKAPQRDQRTVENVLEPYMESDTTYTCVALSQQPCAAGTGAYLGPEEFEMVDVDASKLPRGAKFGVPISGDSMEPVYHDGDIAIIGGDAPRVGQVGLFTMDGMGYLKRLGNGVLESLNAAYEPIPMDDSIRCNGRVLGTLTAEDVRR